MNTLSNSEFKMLFSVATYRVEETDENGKVHVLYRRKRGFIYEGNDYYTPDYSNNRSPSRLNLKANLFMIISNDLTVLFSCKFY